MSRMDGWNVGNDLQHRRNNVTLRERQSLFVKLVADLIQYAYRELGYELTFGETWRSPDEAKRNAEQGEGIANSLHCQRLAIDLNLFIDGKYCADSESHRPLGEYWKKLHPLCRWGGDFRDKNGNPKPDGCHYSVTHEGRA